jgi:protein ImuB
VPEELPFEEQGWDFPLESVEPLLFVLKGLCARLGSRLEGRGQAAQELLLTVEYDKPIAALRRSERERGPDGRHPPGGDCLEIQLKLASPLAHAEALERIVRARLQRETLFAPALALRLRVTAITESHQWQQSLNVEGGLAATLSSDPRTLAVLVAELTADLGVESVGRLEAHDSHLLEKSSCFVPIHELADERRADSRESRSEGDVKTPKRATSSTERSVRRVHEGPAANIGLNSARDKSRDSVHDSVHSSALGSRLPTRLIAPIEFKAPLKEKEILVLDQRAFIIEAIQFEERLEAVEWWAPSPISRDYFRLWLSSLSSSSGSSASGAASAASGFGAALPFGAAGRSSAPSPAGRLAAGRGDGLEVLVYLNRDDGKRYVQALYD